MAAYHETEKARAALAKAKTTNDPEIRLKALEAATEALADAISALNAGEESSFRGHARRYGN